MASGGHGGAPSKPGWTTKLKDKQSNGSSLIRQRDPADEPGTKTSRRTEIEDLSVDRMGRRMDIGMNKRETDNPNDKSETKKPEMKYLKMKKETANGFVIGRNTPDVVSVRKCEAARLVLEIQDKNNKLIRVREDVVKQLRAIGVYIHKILADKNKAKIAGAAIAIGGATATVVSGAIAIATLGLATPLVIASVVGTAAAMAGAGVGVGATAVVGKMVENERKKAEELIQEDDALRNEIERLAKDLNSHVNDLRSCRKSLNDGDSVGSEEESAAASSPSVARGFADVAGAAALAANDFANIGIRVGGAVAKCAMAFGILGVLTGVPVIALEAYNILRVAKDLNTNASSDLEILLEAAAAGLESQIKEMREYKTTLSEILNDLIR